MALGGAEMHAGAGSQISHHLGNEDLVVPCERHNPRRHVKGDASEIRSMDLALSDMDPRTDLEVQSPHPISDGASTSDRSGR
jgi:hypothetical protein